MVLHDLPTGAMNHLGRFLDRAASLGARFRQDFPPACVPMVAGNIVGAITPYMSDFDGDADQWRARQSKVTST